MRRFAPLLVCVVLAGCGGGDDDAAVRSTPALPQSSAADDRVREALHLPGRVPLRAVGDAPEEDVAVVRGWLDELSRGEVQKAARRFGLPARFQNIASVALIKTPEQALAVTDSLPCGARMTEAGGAAGFVIYEARLTDRPGGDCGQGVGGVVRGAVLVRDGHMIEWYRLPDVRHGQGTDAGPVV
ncbi:MAG: hypothetical protein ACJ762_09885 [Solirubrobacteraceae bacterium]